MQTLANWDGGPGPWILFFPLIWAAVVAGVVTVLRRTACMPERNASFGVAQLTRDHSTLVTWQPIHSTLPKLLNADCHTFDCPSFDCLC